MIQNSSLKTAIIAKFVHDKNLSEYERIATEIIFYKYLLALQEANPTQSNDILSLVESYSTSFHNKFKDLKNKYTCYLTIIQYLTNIDAHNLLSLNEEDINHVYQLYQNSKEIVDFNIHEFIPEIYGGYNLPLREYKYLYNIHFNVMCPIIKYYMKFYGCEAKSMKIVDSNSLNHNIGKKIEFYIEGIPASTIYSDINNNKFPFEFYKVSFKYPNLEIINI